ncbi:MAG: hypothetical protein L6Q99_17320 [Planctomycetes bacterium]|nr:hypothetical protein [Planctomycetota bacterium]
MKRWVAKMKRFAALLLVSSAGALSAGASRAGVEPDVEGFARLLVGDADPRATQRENLAEWLAAIAAEPEHPLVEGSLRLVAASAELCASTPELADAALALSGERMGFRAKGELARLQGRIRAARAPLAAPLADAFPGWLSRFSVLGPLGPLDDVDGARRESARLAEPGFEREHAGVRGTKLRWLARSRSPLEPTTPRLDFVLGSALGHALVAFEFESASTAPAWLEIDARDGRTGFVFDVASVRDAPWRGSVEDPSFDWCLNGEVSGRVDFRAAARSALELVPVRVARGMNVLVLSVATDAGATFAVRVLDERGEPLAGVAEPQDEFGRDRSPREFGAAQPPRALTGLELESAAQLAALADRGPCTEAVLGVLTILDGRAAEGLAHVEAALELAPDDPALISLAATVTKDAPHLPDAWKRNRARELYERTLAAKPDAYGAGLELAKRLAAEDKKEDALRRLKGLTEIAPAREEAWLELERVYDELELDVRAEDALEHAFATPAPSYTAYDRAITRLDRAGLSTRAYLALVQAVQRVGVNQLRLAELAERAHALGLVSEAEAWHRARIERAPIAAPRIDYADFLVDCGRDDDATWTLAEATALAPHAPDAWRRLARIAARRGDRDAARAAWRAVLERDPSDVAARAELEALDSETPLTPFVARRRAADERAAEALAGYDAKRFDDSVVRVLDWSDVTVFADGGYEMLTHTILHLRDLQACEAHGTQRLEGEVLEVVTRKADGREFEPIEADGEYVMPQLEPGDFVETIVIDRFSAPRDGIVRFPRWQFASVDEPFHVSHYSVTAPDSLALIAAERQFGELVAVERVVSQAKLAAGGGTTWSYTSHDTPRIVPEPGAPEPQHFLPNVEFGMAPNRERLAASLASLGAVSARVTPPIARAAEEATAGLSGDEARARALWAFVARALDRRNPATFASATNALLTREGNPVWLYSALLDAVKIDHEVVFSRGLDPAADLDAAEEFYDESRWLGRMLVRVRPQDGPEAWCDPSSKTLGYGVVVQSAPRAECFGTRSHKFFAAPDVPLVDRVGQHIDLDVRVAADLSAEIDVALSWTGNLGFAQKESLRDVPKAQKKQMVTRLAASIVPGFDLASFELSGVDSDDQPVVIAAKGRVKRFVDDAGGALSTRFPAPPLDLTRQLAGGEGERRLPYHLGSSIVFSAEVRLTLPEGFALQGDGPRSELVFENGTYTLSTRHETDSRTWIVRRALALPPFLLSKDRYGDFAQFASAVDEVERARLSLTR